MNTAPLASQPYAIGNELGGHKAIDPSLGTMEDFIWLEKEIRSRGMEIALDFAINSKIHSGVPKRPRRLLPAMPA